MNIVLVGECGTGKSSLINMIVGRDIAKASNDTEACTTEVRAYETSIDGRNVKLWDTPGFNEGSTIRSTATTRSLEMVVQSLQQIKTKGGIHLLVYCINGNRAKAVHLRHYDIIRAFLPCRVPMVAVVTRLERYQVHMEDWWTTNEQELVNLGMEFTDHACITTIPNSPGLRDSFRERRLRSQRVVRDLIVRKYPSQSSPVAFPTIPTTNSATPERKGSEDAVLRSINALTMRRRAPRLIRRVSTSMFV